MSHLKALKAAATLSDVAHLLGVLPGMLSHELYKKPKTATYSKFSIPKRFGGTREISAPNKDLKLLQHRLALILVNCYDEIRTSQGHAEDAKHPGIAHGFKRGHSILTNGLPHVTRRRVFNVDLQNFFGTINFGRVRGYFISNKHFSLNPKVATVIAQIACNENQLPQGSPCSPVISNLISHSLDISLVALANATDCTYTRYADDLTFSSNKPKFSSRVAVRPDPNLHEWQPGHGLSRLIKRAGFSINESKTRMQYRDSRQEVTGVTVNRKLNAPAPYRNTARAMADSLFKTGTLFFSGSADDGKGGKLPTKTAGTPSQLIGMLAHIDWIDRFNQVACEQNDREPPKTDGRVRLFRRTLYFDYFYAPSMPVVVCEGKTDNVYLRCAVKSRAHKYPLLAPAGSPPKLPIRFFKYSDRRTNEITEIRGGVGGLCKLIKYYHEDVTTKFKAPPPKFPVMILIDNDLGANSVFGAIAGITGKHKPTGKEPFIHVTQNLYVVPTPLGSAGSQTMIEDFFPPSTLSEKLNGKAFDRAKDADNTTHYGKAAFARDVVSKNASTIDFSGFDSILDRMVAVLADYASKHPGPTAV